MESGEVAGLAEREVPSMIEVYERSDVKYDPPFPTSIYDLLSDHALSYRLPRGPSGSGKKRLASFDDDEELEKRDSSLTTDNVPTASENGVLVAFKGAGAKRDTSLTADNVPTASENGVLVAFKGAGAKRADPLADNVPTSMDNGVLKVFQGAGTRSIDDEDIVIRSVVPEGMDYAGEVEAAKRMWEKRSAEPVAQIKNVA